MLILQRFRLVILALIAALAGWHGAAVADAPQPPDALVKQVVEDVMTTVKSDRDIQSGDMSKISALVETKVLPYIDFQKMTASAVGRNWATASADQQKQIVDQFRNLLVYTYAGALSQVRDQTIQYRPLRADASDTQVEVKTQVVNTHGGDPIELNYKLLKEDNGWKIVDVNVLGVWLVQNYRSSFQQEVSQGGIDGLIKSLVAKNKALASGNASPHKT